MMMKLGCNDTLPDHIAKMTISFFIQRSLLNTAFPTLSYSPKFHSGEEIILEI